MLIAVLITCHNRKETTICGVKSLFSSLDRLIDVGLDLWLVDDGSTDGTGECIKRIFPQVNVIRGNGELYWSRGMNLAWKESLRSGKNYDAWIWMNDDNQLNENALPMLINDASKTNWEGAIIGTFTETNGNISYGVRENWRFVEPDGKPRLTQGDISGNLVLVPLAVFEKVGIISDVYLHAYGDFDYSARMRKAGVPYYVSSSICGVCENDHKDEGVFSKTISRRLRAFWGRDGRVTRDCVVYRYRHYGCFRALVSALNIFWLVVSGRRSVR